MSRSANTRSLIDTAARSYLQDRRGSFALLFGLTLVVVIEVIGAGIDFANAYRVKSLLNKYSDAATLAAVSVGSSGFIAASAMSSDGSVSAAADAARQMFNAEPMGAGYAITNLLTTATKSGNALTATVSYQATVQTNFLGVIGLSTVAVAGQSTATNSLPTYMDFYLLLDNSPSMGVAATLDDIATMVANTPDRCAFACHDQSNPNNYYNLARRLGVTTRIDVLRSATQQLMTAAVNAEIVPDQFRFQVNTFNMAVATIANLSSDLASVTSQASAIDLMPVPYQGWNNDQITDYKTVLRQIDGDIPHPGSGSSPSDPQKVLFLVTDGVADYAQGSSRVISPLDPTWCTSMKARGVQIAILYTTYLPLPTNAFYMANVAPWSGNIAPSLKSCASPGYFFEVSMNQGISAAMQAMFMAVVKGARIER